MLRTTILKIKRVCSVAFLPRALRATRSPSGKFEKFSYGVYRAQLKYKSDTCKQEDSKQPKRIIEFSTFSPDKTPIRNKLDTFEDINKGDLTNLIRTGVNNKQESQCVKCERVIAQVFDLDPLVEKQKICETPITLDEISHQAVESDAKKVEENIAVVNEKGQRYQRPVTTEIETKILPNISQVNIVNSENRHPEKNEKCSEFKATEVFKEAEHATVEATTYKDDAQHLGQKTEEIKETPVIEDQQADVEGFNVAPKVLEQTVTAQLAGNLLEDERSHLSVPEQMEERKFDNLASRCMNVPDDQIDERLLQELYGLRVPHTNQSLGMTLCDEDYTNMGIAKEERIMADKCNLSYYENENEKKNVDFNILQRLYPTYDGLLSDTETKYEEVNLTLARPMGIYVAEKPISTTEQASVAYGTVEQETYEKRDETNRPMIYPSPALIDPYDKKTLAFDNAEWDATNTCQNTDVQVEPIQNIEKDIKLEAPIEEPRKEEFDPKYFVTCSETCPISPDGLTTVPIEKEKSVLRTAEDVFDDLALKKEEFKRLNTEENKPASENEVKDIPTESELMLENENASDIVNEDHSKDIVNLEPTKEEITANKETEKNIDTASQPAAVPLPAVPPPEKVNAKIAKPNIEDVSDEKQQSTIENDPLRSNVTTGYVPLPSLNDEQASLSELLKRVRERNRIDFCKTVDMDSSAMGQIATQAAVADPAVGKCGKNPPPCPPPAPKCPPSDPCKPPKCPPPQPAHPKPTKNPCRHKKPDCPPKPNPCAKFEKCNYLGVPILALLVCRPQMNLSLPITSYNKENTDYYSVKRLLTEKIVVKLESLGIITAFAPESNIVKALGSCYFETSMQRERFVGKDFEPWTPIPSWPIPKKAEKHPLVCPKEGCKEKPVPQLNPPCTLKPCTNFPKRSFSMAGFLTFLFRDKCTI